MHFGLDEASAMIATPFSPNGPPEIFGGSLDFIARFSPGRCPPPNSGLFANHERGFPRFGVAAGGDDGMGTAFGNRVMTSTGVIGPAYQWEPRANPSRDQTRS